MESTRTLTKISYREFLENFKKSVQRAFYEIDDLDQFVQKRGFPDPVFKEIMSAKPLAVAIPTEYGGRGCKVKECLGILAASSYESLPLSLTFGINIALFLEPVSKYASERIKPRIFDKFLKNQNMGGLMITEPDYGSDALNMQTFNVPEGDKFRIKGTKHWQGLTGLADYWLMTCRSKSESGKMSRDLDFFITDESIAEQKIEVAEYYNNLGLYPIPYGLNNVDVAVPVENKLIPETTGLKLMMDLLHRSRFQFPGMGMGFIKRLLDDSIEHCTKRFVGGKPLMALDQVKLQLSKIQSAFTICSAMCARSSEYSGIENNLATDVIEANSIKAYLTDLMQNSAQLASQLLGGSGYKAESRTGRGIMDSRPFRIFEGSNDMLYTQIGEMVLKKMRRAKVSNLSSFMEEYELTSQLKDRFKSMFNFELAIPSVQRQIIDFGKIMSRLVSADQVLQLENKGFRSDLVNSCLQTIQHEMESLLRSLNSPNATNPIIEYNDQSAWLDFA